MGYLVNLVPIQMLELICDIGNQAGKKCFSLSSFKDFETYQGSLILTAIASIYSEILVGFRCTRTVPDVINVHFQIAYYYKKSEPFYEVLKTCLEILLKTT